MAAGTEPSGDAYERGHLAGEIAARLAGHDKHFAAINGSLEKIAANQASQTLAIQRQGDTFTAELQTVIATARAAAATVVATAEALRLADEARRTTDRDATTKSDRSWTPVQRFLAVMGAIVVTVGTAVTIYATLHR